MVNLLVVRGNKHSTDVDADFVNVAHSMTPRSYVAVKTEGGAVVERKVYRSSERGELEAEMKEPKYGRVEVDMRTEKSLLPLTSPSNSVRLDLDRLRLTKSDEHLKELTDISRHVHGRVGPHEGNFRGLCFDKGYKYAEDKKDTKAFTQYRGGAMSPSGLKVELAHVEPKTRDWEERMERVYKGLDAVERRLDQTDPIGLSRMELNDLFASHLDRENDVWYGDVLHHGGHKAYDSQAWETIQPYTWMILGASVGDSKGGPQAHVFRSAHGFSDKEQVYGSTDRQYRYRAAPPPPPPPPFTPSYRAVSPPPDEKVVTPSHTLFY